MLLLFELPFCWDGTYAQGHDEVRTPIPRREDMTGDRGLLIVATATHRQRDLFFFLVQSEVGDIYKVTVEFTADATSATGCR